MSWNFFQSLNDDANPAGTEDVLTGALVSLINGLPEVQQQFLQWIQPHVHVDLDPSSGGWRARGQSRYPTARFGDAYVDMVLARGAVELWFEHKITATLGNLVAKDGTGEVIGQLQKYNCHARPEYEADTGRRVLLFAITGRAVSIPTKDLGDIHDEHGGGGYVVPAVAEQHLLWKDLHPHLRAALAQRRSCAGHRFETMLLAEFLAWWESQVALVQLHPDPALFPVNQSERGVYFEPLAIWMRTAVRGIANVQTYGGVNVNAVFRPEEAWNCVMIQPVRVSTVRGWSPENGEHLLRVSVRSRPDVGVVTNDANWLPCADRPVLLHRKRDKKGIWHRAYVALLNWPDRVDAVAQAHEIRVATHRALREIEAATDIRLLNDGY